MPAPITYSQSYFADDGTEINVSVQAPVFHDATYANRLQGGFDSVQATIGRFVGIVDLVGLDADGTVVDVTAASTDGSARVDLQVVGTDTHRIAAATVRYRPQDALFQEFTAEFWKPDADDTGGSGSTGNSGITLLGSTDSHTGEGSGELRGFQGGARQFALAASGTLSPLSQWIVRDSARSYTLAGASTGTDTGGGDDGGSDGGDDGGGGVITKPFPYPDDPKLPVQVTEFTYPTFYGHRALFPDRESDEWVYVRLDILSGPPLRTAGPMRFQLTADVVTTADYQEITQEAVIDRLRRFSGRWVLKFANNLYFTTLSTDLGGQRGQGVDFVATDATTSLTVQGGWTRVQLSDDNTGIGDFT